MQIVVGHAGFVDEFICRENLNWYQVFEFHKKDAFVKGE